VRISKGLYLTTTILCAAFIWGSRLYLVASEDVVVSEVTTPVGVLFLQVTASLVSMVFGLRLLYRAWAAIQDGHTHLSPGRAVGYMFIPVYDLFHMFSVTYGFAKAYNAYLVRHSLNLPKLPQWFFLAFAIWCLAVGLTASIPGAWLYQIPIGIVVGFFYISKVCDAVNALPGSDSSFARITPA